MFYRGVLYLKFYTKEWYELMQKTDYTTGLKAVPDKEYSDKEIKAFYESDLKKEIARDKKLHKFMAGNNTSAFDFLFGGLGGISLTIDEDEPACETEFDPSETIACFKESYRNLLRYAASNYPSWVSESVDKRLLALWRMPKSALMRLKAEEKEAKRRFNAINKKAEKALSSQDIPEGIKQAFCYHDASVLRISNQGKNTVMYLRKDGCWPDDDTPYAKLVFKNVSLFEREDGIVLRCAKDGDGFVSSRCYYLYDEIYRTKDGFEFHMMFTCGGKLKYFTVRCENVEIFDGVDLWKEF